VAPRLGALQKYQDVALYVVDIKDWGSPVAQQFNIRSIPEFKIYMGRNQLLAEGNPAKHWFEDVVNGKVKTR